MRFSTERVGDEAQEDVDYMPARVDSVHLGETVVLLVEPAQLGEALGEILVENHDSGEQRDVSPKKDQHELLLVVQPDAFFQVKSRVV